MVLDMMLLAILSRYLLYYLGGRRGHTCLTSENALRIWAYVSAPGVFAESISDAGMRDSFRIVHLSGKPGGTARRKVEAL